MTARLRSGATIRKTGTSRPAVHFIGSNNPFEEHRNESGITSKLGDHRSEQCYVCKGEHYVNQCSRLLAMTPSERWKIVKEQRGCFSCLKRGKGHTSFNCSRRVLCGRKCSDSSACKRRHHGLLHEESSSTLNVAFIQESSRAILPVISGFKKGKQGDLMETNVFYDSGAQVSLIRSARTEQLGLEHRPVKIVITKVGGVE